MRLLPRNTLFYDLLEQQADNVVAICERLCDLVTDFRDVEARQNAIKDLEHAGDQLTQELFRSMLSTFITPLDKDDLAALASGLDDVVDYVDAAASRFVIYRIEQPTEEAVELAGLLLTLARSVAQMVRALRDLHGKDTLMEAFREMHDLENRTDSVYRKALGNLFNTPGVDPIYVIKWKEIYERMEMAADKCEDVANVVEGIVLKYA